MMLEHGELCVCWMTEVLGLSPSTVSRHLSQLRNAGLISPRKNGHWTYYRLSDTEGDSIVSTVVQWLRESLKDDGSGPEHGRREIRPFSAGYPWIPVLLVGEDGLPLDQILSMDPERLMELSGTGRPEP